MRRRLRTARTFMRPNAGSLVSLALFLYLAVLGQPIYSQTNKSHTNNPQEGSMKHYALFFHASRTLTHEEQKQRVPQIAAWVKRVTDMGITIDPRSLDDTATTFFPEASKVATRNGPSDPTLAFIVFFDSSSRDQAEEIARTHPGRHYGVTVEVREWTSPVPVAVAQ